MKIKRYSRRTISLYSSILLKFFHHFGDRENLGTKDIFWYINMQVGNNISLSYQKQLIWALKLYYNWFLWKNISFQYIYPERKEYKIPNVISQQDIKKILGNTQNLKHICIISLLYSGGLRLSECIYLKIEDVDSKEMKIHIKNSKWAKDRVIPLSKNMLTLLRKYYQEYHPKIYLFEWQWWGTYSEKSIQNIVKNSAKKSWIIKNVTPHTLRHSYATHVLENGTDIRIIQRLLWHKSIKTTQIYTHISDPLLRNIQNPFDTLFSK